MSSIPVLWGLVFTESYGLNEQTTFKTEEKAKAYSDRCSPKPRVVPLFALGEIEENNHVTSDDLIEASGFTK